MESREAEKIRGRTRGGEGGRTHVVLVAHVQIIVPGRE